MQVRSTIAGVAIALAAVAGVAACGSDDSSSSSASTSAASGSAASSTEQAAPSDLDTAKAQQIVRTVVDPATTPEAAAALVDSTDPAIGQKLNGFAKGASAGGYTPDIFTVSSVSADGADKAKAAIAVASPHTPAPVTVSYGFAKVDGSWKLSSDAVTSLLGMASGPR
ncbi:DUF4878 domain-containing protein [Williamsia phyllosphaerae]|uniref:Low molecular weight antigen MTB12-like C-terminal domain-containing protein n=1 Tax=Williamsia phyllosphaerae TaxID=885042 RepID=A0ABQ1US52_9NOCA|nr:DUF4878 domain-containing protein [Williamsia phyllosphaerae]GGF24909.1 hypothetical protein GCM10007298_20990 [Williamsia phyllosphaerae]